MAWFGIEMLFVKIFDEIKEGGQTEGLLLLIADGELIINKWYFYSILSYLGLTVQ